jgi:hypothetical protein
MLLLAGAPTSAFISILRAIPQWFSVFNGRIVRKQIGRETNFSAGPISAVFQDQRLYSMLMDALLWSA